MNAEPHDHIRALLRDAVETVETTTPDPDSLRDRSTASLQAAGTGRAHPRQWIAIASAAAAVIAVAGGTALLVSRQSHSGGHAPVAAGPTAATTPAQTGTASTPTTSGTSPGSTGVGRTPACTASNLTATLDPTRTGPANGTENVVIILHNSSATACQLGGPVALSGLTSTGAATPLGFHSSLDPGVADPSPAAGPGQVMPGKDGALHLTLALNNCSKPGVKYERLQITLSTGSALVMRFPNELTATGCYGYAAQPGPIPNP